MTILLRNCSSYMSTVNTCTRCQSQSLDYISLWHLSSPWCRTFPVFSLSSLICITLFWFHLFLSRHTHIWCCQKCKDWNNPLGNYSWTSMPLKNNKYIGYDNDAVSSLNNFVTADDHFIYKNIKCSKILTIQYIACLKSCLL